MSEFVKPAAKIKTIVVLEVVHGKVATKWINPSCEQGCVYTFTYRNHVQQYTDTAAFTRKRFFRFLCFYVMSVTCYVSRDLDTIIPWRAVIFYQNVLSYVGALVRFEPIKEQKQKQSKQRLLYTVKNCYMMAQKDLRLTIFERTCFWLKLVHCSSHSNQLHISPT